MAGMRKPLPVAWAVFDGIDRMHIAKGYSEAESCAEDIGGEIVPLYRSPRWIPVSERLPPDGTVVLAWNGKRVVFGYARDGDWIDTLYGWVIPNGPSHWMPLPEPPAG
jgi:hypothetical protein